MEDGRTVLHLAAEWCLDSEPLEHLFSYGCLELINKQDQYGWTALHYASIARNSAVNPKPFSKVVSLIRNGADTKTKGKENPRNIYDQPEGTFTANELLRFARPARLDLMLQVLRKSGIDHTLEADADIFYDAQEVASY
jgi:ankyrin repeat protein